MADIREVIAALTQVADSVMGTMGPLQQALSDVEAQIGQLMAIMDGTNQDDIQAALAALNAQKAAIEQAMGMTQTANSEIEGIRSRL